jgi:hypothetical protein
VIFRLIKRARNRIRSQLIPFTAGSVESLALEIGAVAVNLRIFNVVHVQNYVSSASSPEAIFDGDPKSLGPNPPADLAREALEEVDCRRRVPAIAGPIRRAARRRGPTRMRHRSALTPSRDDDCETVVARKRADADYAWRRSGTLAVSE